VERVIKDIINNCQVKGIIEKVVVFENTYCRQDDNIKNNKSPEQFLDIVFNKIKEFVLLNVHEFIIANNRINSKIQILNLDF